MTDKIIIDGVDVSGWTLDEIEYHLSYKTKSKIIEAYTYIYKQLQRKEQECKELKQWQEDAENILKTQLDNFDKVENRYKQALDKIEEICIKRNYLDYGELLDDVISILNEVKDD